MDFPKQHKKITEDLIGGRFIVNGDEHFQSMADNEDFYRSFFKHSFGYELNITSEYGYLTSNETGETTSRDISIFFAILAYELDKDGRNFLDQLQYGEFNLDEIEKYFENSSYIDLLQGNKQLKDSDARRGLVNTMARRNIIEKTGEDRFIFTPAYKVFIDFAKDLAAKKIVIQ